MYKQRIRIFIIITAALLTLCTVHLARMQLSPGASIHEKIALIKKQRGSKRSLKTIRGQILDRNDEILASDEPRFELAIEYGLCSFYDERVRRAMILKAEKKTDDKTQLKKIHRKIEQNLNQLERIIEKCEYLGFDRSQIEEQFKKINDRIWNMRAYITRARKKLSLQQFENKYHSSDKRLIVISNTDLAVMYQYQGLFSLKTDDDIFTTQMEFMDLEKCKVLSHAYRNYPYASTAAQTIGWVNKPRQVDIELFADVELANYVTGDTSGREDGIEYVCEALLRGKRGEFFTDLDGKRFDRAKPQYGKDVKLTIDIELQKKIENLFYEYSPDSNNLTPIAAAVIDVASADILALVSVPTYDLNKIRTEYSKIENDKNIPLLNRAINKQYLPGSVIKPIILIAALQSGKITPWKTISCPSRQTKKPRCWFFKKYKIGHDEKWENHARNAIKGSCNCYFSKLAQRIDPLVLQGWLFKFGYGRKILSSPKQLDNTKFKRLFRQIHGSISSENSDVENPVRLEDLNGFPLKEADRKWFGIGQGNIWVSPLQVANAMAVLARDGLFRTPNLYFDESNNSDTVFLDISPQTLDVVRDGMNAVVNEDDGTAYSAFDDSDFDQFSLKLFGKTGSTEKPYNAWFAGFATDNENRAIAFALIIEGGQSGAQDAAPIAEKLIKLCIQQNYIGSKK